MSKERGPMRRALVTGGAGFIGSNIARELERRGLEVVVVDDFRSSRFENLRGYKGDVVAADLRRMEEWAPKVGAVDVIFHEGAITDTTVMDQKLMMEVNVDAFRNLLDFAAATGVRRVVYASSAGVYGAGSIPMREGGEYEPMNIYGFSKKVMEVVAARFSLQEPGIPVVGLRYFNVYGPGEAYKDKAASMIWQLYLQMKDGRRPRIFKSGEQFRDQIYVKDVVEANMKAAQAEHSGVYNVCTGKPATFNKIVEVLNGVLRTSLAPDYFDNPYSFFQSQTQGDPSAAEKGLGFAARYGIEEGIQDYLGGR